MRTDGSNDEHHLSLVHLDHLTHFDHTIKGPKVLVISEDKQINIDSISSSVHAESLYELYKEFFLPAMRSRTALWVLEPSTVRSHFYLRVFSVQSMEIKEICLAQRLAVLEDWLNLVCIFV